MLIDVSNHQGTIDWRQVAPAVSGAYLKVTEGTAYVDPYWRGNHDAARGNGIPVGAYHFADLGSPIDEANHFADQVLQADWQLRPVLDIETAGATASWIRDFRNQFQLRTGSAAFRVYTSRSFLQGALDPSGWLTPETDIWMAAYDVSPGWDHPALVLWQSTESATVPGVVGNVDADQFMHGWTPAADQGAPDMQLSDTYKDWAGNTQSVQSTYDHLDQRTLDIQAKIADLHRLFAEAGTVTAHDPSHTKTNLADLIADSAAWQLAENQAVTALAGQVTAEEAHILGALKGAQTGSVDVIALAAAIESSGLPAAIVQQLGQRLAATPTPPPAA